METQQTWGKYDTIQACCTRAGNRSGYRRGVVESRGHFGLDIWLDIWLDSGLDILLPMREGTVIQWVCVCKRISKEIGGRLTGNRIGRWSKVMPGLLLLGVTACVLTANQPMSLQNQTAELMASSFDAVHHLQANRSLFSVNRKLDDAATVVHNPTTIGYSTGGLPIERYTFGAGPMRIVFVGGIHGGAEWNTILLAYAAIDYFDRHPEEIPSAVTLQIVPAANPDGLRRVTGRWGRFQADDVDGTAVDGRFNQNGVDLNRNWGCAWSATAWWGSTKTSGGRAPFSERETRVLRDFFLGEGMGLKPVQGVIFWHSAVPGVFAGGCEGIYPAAERLATIYGRAAGYPYGDAFSYYPITGDATNWLSMQQIPAITVELVTRNDPEWPQNLAGMLAALDYLAGRDLLATEDNRDTVVPIRTFAR